MKKIIQTIKLRKFKTGLSKEIQRMLEGDDFLVLYKDDSIKYIYTKDDLIKELEKQHIRPIKYIFDMSDRIVLDIDIQVDITKV